MDSISYPPKSRPMFAAGVEAPFCIGLACAALNRAVEPLCTANDKHYKSIPGIALDVFCP